MIDITSRDENGVHIVEFDGKLNTNTSSDADKYLLELIESGAINIILNLEQLDYISSTGLRVILATGKKLAKNGGKIVICNPNVMVLDVLKMSGFSQMFTVCESEDEALKAF